MKHRGLTLVAVLFTATAALFVLFWFTRGTQAAVQLAVLNSSTIDPSITAVQPDSAPNDIDSSIVIQGSGFTATFSGTQVITAPTVYLGDTGLVDVVWGNTTTLSATVPWGLEPEIYSLTMVNPDGISATLPGAFTVTDGLGEFLTGGPYGGMSVQLALKPGDQTSIYASMFGAGLFISEDAAGDWEPIHDHDWPIQFDFDSQDPDILYFGADSNDLYRSMDNGASWERISEDFHTQHGCFRTYPVAHPSQAGSVYFGMGSCGDIYLGPGEGGVFYSTNYGDTWDARNTDLSDLDIQVLAIHPDSPDTLLAGTSDGDLFYTTNAGTHWSWSTTLTGTVTRLYFNPYEGMESWAITRSDAEGRGYLYRSTNLTDWTVVDINVQPQGGSIHGQMTFLPGSVWLASQSVFSSTDSGATWNPLNGPNRSATAIAISPDDPQVIYVGTDFGVEKSSDGGENWGEVNTGLAALVPNAVAVSPDDPDTVYVKTHQGIFVSHNSGNDWGNLGYGEGGSPGGNLLAVDHFTSTRLYLKAGCQDSFCMDISPDGGLNWELATSTLPPAYAGWSCDSFSITPSPHTAGQVLVGASLSPPSGGDYVGVFYRSEDYGANWNYIEPPQAIKRITEIAYDAFDPNLIYAATYESGLWRSTDGGDNWTYVPVANVQPPIVVGAIAVHPNIANKIYIRTSSYAAGPNPEPELWVSEDAGARWQPLTYVFLGIDLLVAPPLPDQVTYSLYTGCEAGLCRSIDDGITWISIEGVPRPEILTAASDDERSIIYMGTPGGLVDTAGVLESLTVSSVPGRGSIGGGGVYRLTTVLANHWVYLPLASR